MKRLITLLLILTVILSFGGCREAEAIDSDEFINNVLENVEFDDEVAEINEGVIERLYTLPEGVSGRVFIGSGATAEEIAVFTAEDEAGAEAMEENAKAHIESQSEVYASYLPDEVERLKNAVVIRQGLSVVVVVSADEQAEEKVKGFLE